MADAQALNAADAVRWASVVAADAQELALAVDNAALRRVRWAAAKTAKYCWRRTLDYMRSAALAARAADLEAAASAAQAAEQWAAWADLAGYRAGCRYWIT